MENEYILSTSFNIDRLNIFRKINESFHRFSESIAVRYDGMELTYRELNQRSNSIAHEIIKYDVTPGTLLPIITRGGVDMVCSMVGIIRAGCAFVPIDAAAPPSRISDMLDTLKAPLTFLDGQCDLPIQLTGQVLSISEALPSTEELFRDRSGNDLLYGFFTSGSTGKPKCCLNAHKGLINRFSVMSNVFDLQPNESVLQNSKHIFDSSLWQILWPICVGATVIVPRRDGILDVGETINTIYQNNIVMTDFVPSILDVFLSHIAANQEVMEKLRSMRHILVGGEEVSARIINTCSELLPWVQITNTYGPTEASIGMVFHHFKGIQSDPLPLGTAIQNTNAVVVNEELEPVNDGEIGQIIIGGECMGLGYLGEAEKSNKSFVRAPQLKLGSDIVFKTGDLGHYRDNLLYFNGRIDHQVKILGVRIELNEVENCIESLEGVTQARVVTKNDPDGHSTLVAFLSSSRQYTGTEIKDFLASRLPKEAIPSLFRYIDEFPRTVSGKINRKVLTDIANQEVDMEASTGDDNLDIITSMLVKYTNNNELNSDDNFFECGLDSLNSIKLSIEIEKEFGITFTSSDLYNYSTITLLYEYLLNRDFKPTNPDDTYSSLPFEKIQHFRSIRIPKILDSSAVLLTGATGYVGIHVLRELIETTHQNVICFVRAHSVEEALARIKQIASSQEIEELIDWSRVEVICADLCKPKAMLLPYIWQNLGRRVKEVFHLGADVNFVKPYAELESANVDGTITLASFALEYEVQHFHYISTNSVVPFRGDILIHPFEIQKIPRDGYSQSKLIAENIIARLVQQNIPSTIYRLGEVMPSQNFPIPNPKALTTLVLQTFLELGISYDSCETLDYSPVDIVSKIIVGADKGLRRSYDKLQIVDVSNPRHVPLNCFSEGFDDAGLSIRLASKQEFISELDKACSNDKTSSQCLFVNNLIRESASHGNWNLFKSQSNSISGKTEEMTPELVQWPEVNSKYLSSILGRIAGHFE